MAASGAEGDATASRRLSSSVALAGRAAGSLAMHCMTSAVSAGGESGRNSVSGAGASDICATSSLCGGRPANGGRPARSSYAMQPKA